MRAAILLLLVAAASPPAATLSFPRDHGAHAEAALEWWYYTGHLQDASGRPYGFQLTFFRARDLHFAHFAWTDVARRRFLWEEKTHLAVPGIASAAAEGLDVVNEDWSAAERGGAHHLRASGRVGRLELTLTPVKPPVLHGEGGLSRKGPGPKEYSRYVSITRLRAVGSLRAGQETIRLSGEAWFDHEWGPGALPQGATGWDWYALQLSDGSELMLYRMRRPGGAETPYSSGTFVPKTGPSVPIAWTDVTLMEARTWKSPRTRAVYPAGWRIRVASLGLDVTVEPLLPDQELVTAESTGVTYWEGACRVAGTRGGHPVSGRAYVELTGYAGRDVPGFAPARGYGMGSVSTFSAEALRVSVFPRVLPTSFVSIVTKKLFAPRRFR